MTKDRGKPKDKRPRQPIPPKKPKKRKNKAICPCGLSWKACLYPYCEND